MEKNSRDLRTFSDETPAESEHQPGGWRNLLEKFRQIGDLRTMALALTAWACLEGSEVEAKDIRASGQGKHVSVSYDQLSTRKDSPDRAHVVLKHLDDFNAISVVPTDVATSDVRQFIPYVYPGEEVKVKNIEKVRSILARKLDDPLLRVYAGIASDEEARDLNPGQAYRAIYYLIKSEFRYSLRGPEYQRYAHLDMFMPDAQRKHELLKNKMDQLEKLTQEFSAAFSSFQAANDEHIPFYALADVRSREQEFRYIYHDSAVSEEIKRYFLMRNSLMDIAGRLGLDMMYSLAQQEVRMDAFGLEKKVVIHGQEYANQITPASNKLLKENDPVKFSTAIEEFARAARVVWERYQAEYEPLAKEFQMLQTQMNKADGQSAEDLFAEGFMVCRNAADFFELLFNILKRYHPKLCNAFVVKIAFESRLLRPTGVSLSDSGHAVTAGIVVKDRVANISGHGYTYTNEQVFFDATPNSDGEAIEVKEAKRLLAEQQTQILNGTPSTEHRESKSEDAGPELPHLLPLSTYQDSFHKFTGSLEAVLIEKLYLDKRINLPELADLIEAFMIQRGQSFLKSDQAELLDMSQRLSIHHTIFLQKINVIYELGLIGIRNGRKPEIVHEMDKRFALLLSEYESYLAQIHALVLANKEYKKISIIPEITAGIIKEIAGAMTVIFNEEQGEDSARRYDALAQQIERLGPAAAALGAEVTPSVRMLLSKAREAREKEKQKVATKERDEEERREINWSDFEE